MSHLMKVKTKYYQLLKSGKKTIELRLWDEKRRQIKVGDEIIFADSACPTDYFNAVVLALHRAENFDALCRIISPQQAGFSSEKELTETMAEFYSSETQKTLGVVGIEIFSK